MLGRRERAHWAPEIAEAKALLLALKLACHYGLQRVVVESDCLSLVSRLNKAALYFTELDNLLEDILLACSRLVSVQWLHVKREGNIVAHNLAKLLPFGVEQVWFGCSPQEISPYVLSDRLSLN